MNCVLRAFAAAIHLRHLQVAAVSISVLFASGFAARGASVASDVYGTQKITLNSGPNFLSVPFHRQPAFSGIVSSLTPNSVTFAGAPGWAAGQFSPRDNMPQYILLVKQDASSSPGVEGDWWHVSGNNENSVTVDAASDDLAAHLGAGDVLELRRLTSLKDLFGYAESCVLNKDSNFSVVSLQEDIIRMVEGTSFTDRIFYHDGTKDTQGYYLNGSLVGNGDGSTITINPDQPIMLIRKTGSAALDLFISGRVQMTRFTHYLAPGANALGMVFPTDAPLNTSALVSSGWTSDLNFKVLSTEEDLIRAVTGSSFADRVFHYAGPNDVNGWYSNGSLQEEYPLLPGRGYIFFRKGPNALLWRQSVPYGP